MRVLLAGGAGYIGSHTLVELLAAGHEICVLDSYANSSPEALTRVRSLTNRDFRVEEADIRDRGAVATIFDSFRPEAVIHFAGLKAVGEGEQKPAEYYDVNVSGTLVLLEAMTAVGCKKIIFSSSATVYGTPSYLPCDENHPCNPASVYGRTKYMAEQIITDWAKAQTGAGAVLLRYFNPVGAHESGRIGEDPNDIPNNLMPFIAQVAVGRRDHLSVFGNDYETRDGTGLRDYIHVVDLARAHAASIDYLADRDGVEIFNLGTGDGTTVLEMVAAFERASGKTVRYEIVSRRPGDVASSYADPRKANESLGWAATHDIDDMCSSAWRWQHKNPDGYK